jgi:hypothetical protein
LNTLLLREILGCYALSADKYLGTLRRRKMSPLLGSGSSSRLFLDCLTLKIEPPCSSETSALYQSIRPNIPKNLNVYPQSTYFTECEWPRFTPLEILIRSAPNCCCAVNCIFSAINTCDTGGFHSGIIEDLSLRGYDVVSLPYSVPAFLTKVVISSLGVEGSQKMQ